MMGNGHAGKAPANDHNISGGWELVSAAVAVKFVRLNAPKGIERGLCGRWCERHCCSCCRLKHKLSSSTHFSISISSRPAEYPLLVSVLPERYLEHGHNCCTGPVYHQGACREETDNNLPILTTETQSTTATSRILWDCEP